MNNTKTPWTAPVQNYLQFRSQLNRAYARAEAGDWEEALASLDEARRAAQFLERFQRLNTAKQKAA